MVRTNTISSAFDYIRFFKVDKPFKDTNFKGQITAPFIDDIVGNTVALTTTFEKCTFNENVKIKSDKNKYCVLTFIDCVFEKDVIAKDAVMEGKVRFRNCTFEGYVNFRNTTFNALLDLWRCTFKQKTIFYKTDFMDIVVLSAVTFEKNVLFTYALIDKLLILRGTKALEGFDLSLAIISGQLSVFDFQLKDYSYNSTYLEALEKRKETPEESFDKVYENVYEKAVSEKAEIPIKNKRETYRILKQRLESQNNLTDSLDYKKLEKETLRVELLNKKIKYLKYDSLKAIWINTKAFLSNRLDRFNLRLNRLSNNHGTSYGRAFLFIVLVGFFFFYLSMIATDIYAASLNVKEWEFNKGLSYFMQFLLPTHKFNYMGEHVGLTSGFYVFDFFGRTIVGYGIYQFIQAFRKFR